MLNRNGIQAFHDNQLRGVVRCVNPRAIKPKTNGITSDNFFSPGRMLKTTAHVAVHPVASVTVYGNHSVVMGAPVMVISRVGSRVIA